MKLLAQLDQLNLDVETKREMASIFQTLLDQTQQAQQEILAQKLKIHTLAMELAYLHRIQYGKKNESLSSVQTSLFKESVLADIAAIHAEIEQIEATARTNLAK